MDKNVLHNLIADLEGPVKNTMNFSTKVDITEAKCLDLISKKYHDLINDLKMFTNLAKKYNLGRLYDYKAYEFNRYKFFVSFSGFPQAILIKVKRMETDTVIYTFYEDDIFINISEYSPKFRDAFIHFLKDKNIVVQNIVSEIVKRSENMQKEEKNRLNDRLMIYYSIINDLEDEKPSKNIGFYENVFIYVPSEKQILRISEGDGNNLSDEDAMHGYVDYIYYEQYDRNEEMTNCNSGQIMLKEMFRDRYKSTFKAIPDVLDMAYGDRNLKYTVLR